MPDELSESLARRFFALGFTDEQVDYLVRASAASDVGGSAGNPPVPSGNTAPRVLADATVRVNTATTLAVGQVARFQGLDAGSYIVRVSYVWSNDSNRDDFIANVRDDSAGALANSYPVAPIHQQEAKDSAGANTLGTGTDQRYAATLPPFEVNVAGTELQVELTFGPQVAGVEAALYYSAVELSPSRPATS